MKAIQTEVQVRGLMLQCVIGVSAHERERRQAVLINVSCRLTEPAILEDEMSASVNYAMLNQAAQHVIEQQQFRLLERLAEAIALAIFDSQPKVDQIKISCEKPHKYATSRAVGVHRVFAR